MKAILCSAFNEARSSAGISVFAYVLMAEHFHLITGSERSESETLRYFKGIAARRVIGYLKDSGFEGSLSKLRVQEKDRQYKHSLWEHHSNTFEIKTEDVFRQKAHYIHMNPVEEGLVDAPDEYLYSSARIWFRGENEVEPLEMDLGKIEWRKS